MEKPYFLDVADSATVSLNKAVVCRHSPGRTMVNTDGDTCAGGRHAQVGHAGHSP